MVDILDIVNAVPAPLRAAWALWIAWGAGQIIWYRRARVVPVVASLPARRPRPRRVPTPVVPVEQAPEAQP